jgi:hypothetical protein
METNKRKTGLFKNFAWASGLLCMLCCTLPPLSVATGVGSLAAIAVFMEKIALVFLLLAIVFFTAWYVKKRKAASCDVDCTSKHLSKKN